MLRTAQERRRRWVIWRLGRQRLEPLPGSGVVTVVAIWAILVRLSGL
jgi:hypothetical protein